MKQLFDHIQQYVTISDDEFTEISQYFERLSLGRKQELHAPQSQCNTIFFTIKGSLHLYFIDDRGTERTVQFAIENWWIGDFLAFYNQSKTDFYVKSIEAADVLGISYENHEKLLQNFPKLESYFRQIYQIAYGSSLFRMKHVYSFSKEELYLNFTHHFPHFSERIPQYLIASYLGLTPEYVSEIRAKLRS